MTEREEKLRKLGFKPVEDPEIIKEHRKQLEETIKDITPVMNALNGWVERSKKEVVCIV